LPIGSTVTFTYVVTNSGNVPLSGVTVIDNNGTAANPADDFNPAFTGGDTNANGLLDLSESWTFTAARIATPGQYTNLATTIGTPPPGAGAPVSDTDTDNHFGGVPAINVVKLTNGTDNNSAPGPFVPVGSTVTFTYVVTNPGDVPLSGVAVRDNNGTPVDPIDDFNATFVGGDTNGNGFLDLLETWTFLASRIATSGQYSNIATATGTPTPGGSPVSDTDADNHFGTNQPPNDIAGGPLSVNENSTFGTLVGVVTGQDLNGDTLTYDLTDNAGGRFAVNNSGQVTVVNGVLLDFEQSASHTIGVRVTDPGGLSFNKAFTVAVNDLNPETAIGDGGDNTLFGGFADDTINGQGGNDVLRGGGGNDYITSGGGQDTALGEAGNDTLIGADGADYLNGGADDDLIVGNDGADTLLGDTGNDYLDGGTGDDLVMGGAGNDTVLGADGNDYVNGEGGNDLVFGGDGIDTLLGADGNDYLSGENGNDIIFGDGGNDTVIGGEGNDYLSGDAGDDNVVGGNGNDTLFAGSGSDYLQGDAGDDFFVFDGTFQTSIIIDFEPGTVAHHDVIQFNGGVFADFADLLGHAVQSGTSTVITDAAGHTLTLANVVKANLISDDFVFLV
jgi:Ca2+-binding RTX toxin-like protein